MAEERLQKVLARAGIASRRAAEELITKGRVKVDGRVVDELGVRVDPRRAKVEVDGNRLMAEPLVYIVLHKPRGVMCTLSDPEGRPTVAELLRAVGVRVAPVGRLDFHTSGALLCTNDGDFSNALAHPRNKAKKVYVAKVQGLVQDDQLLDWRKSIEIDGRATAPAEVRRLRFEGDKTWLELTLREGRNRQVRRLGEATGSLVMRLARISHAGVTAEDLRPGQWRHLSLDELALLKQEFGVPHRVRAAGTEAWEIQVKANARVPRTAAPKRGLREAGERREDTSPHGKSRRPPRHAGREQYAEPASPARASRSNARPEHRGARPEQHGARAERPEQRGARPPARAERAEQRGARPEQRGARPEQRGARPEQRGARAERPEQRGARPLARAERAEQRGARPEKRDARPPARAERPEQRGARPSARAERPEQRGARPPARAERPEQRGARPPERAERSAQRVPERVGRTEARPTRDTRANSRDGRASSRRRGT
jgi:23S rRNA pseudouridine2605 synthase